MKTSNVLCNYGAALQNQRSDLLQFLSTKTEWIKYVTNNQNQKGIKKKKKLLI